jgi:membrane protein YdbS with pleckstrin-like domain
MSSINYVGSSESKVKIPILASIYRVAGSLCILAIGLLILGYTSDGLPLVSAAPGAAVALLLALICFGIAQVIMLVAKIEFNTRQSDSSGQILKELREIVKNTAKPSIL